MLVYSSTVDPFGRLLAAQYHQSGYNVLLPNVIYFTSSTFVLVSFVFDVVFTFHFAGSGVSFVGVGDNLFFCISNVTVLDAKCMLKCPTYFLLTL